jgi:hypothetical protein
MKYSIDCESHQLHALLLEKVMGGWSTVDSDLVETVEPVFQGIVKAALAGSREFSQMKNVVMEKYVYSESTKSITSCASPFLAATAGAHYPHITLRPCFPAAC